LDAPAEKSRAAILELITHDPRVDAQAEARSNYYAYLVDRTGVDVAELETFLQDASSDDDEGARTDLCVGTLGVLTERGRDDAGQILKRFVSYTSDIGHVIWWLAELGRDDLLEPCKPVVLDRCKDDPEALSDALFFMPDGMRKRWIEGDASLKGVWSQLLDSQQKWRAKARSKQRVSDWSKQPLEELVLQCRLRGGEPEILAETGVKRWGEEFPDALLGVLSVSPRGLIRSIPMRALAALPEGIIRPAMLRWVESSDRATWRVGVLTLGRLAKPEDLGLVRSLWPAAWSNRNPDWGPLCLLIRALGTIGDGLTHAELVQAYEEAENSCARADAVESLAKTSPEFGSGFARECLWDCESRARRSGATAVSRDSANVLMRLEEIGCDPAEDEETRLAASEIAG